jgi:hypothetical protein
VATLLTSAVKQGLERWNKTPRVMKGINSNGAPRICVVPALHIMIG